MLRYELCEDNSGIILWGREEDLANLHAAITEIDEGSTASVPENMLLSLAYDIRKTKDGARLEDEQGSLGAKHYWPVILIQASLMRRALSFYPSTRFQQSMAYALEYILYDCALREAFPRYCDSIVSAAESAASTASADFSDLLGGRASYFLETHPTLRPEHLAGIIESLSSFPRYSDLSSESLYEGHDWNTFSRYCDEIEGGAA